MQKVIMITGVTGQVGSYLVDEYLAQDAKVIGLYRRSSVNTFERLTHNLNNYNLKLVECDLTDMSSVSGIVNDYQPDCFINCAAQSHVHTSFEQPIYTFEVNTIGVLNVLESLRKFSPCTRFLQYSTSEMFGNNYDMVKRQISEPYDSMSFFREPREDKCVQNEETEFSPESPYAVSKVASHSLVKLYRQAYKLHASCIIQFNAESPRRGENFVTRKITQYVASIVQCYSWNPSNVDFPTAFDELGTNTQYTISPPQDIKPLQLGNLDAKRDWGFVGDYVKAAMLMLEADHPDDYVVATGNTHSIRDLLDAAFGVVGIDDWEPYVEINKDFYRPVDVEYLCGDAKKIKNALGWKPSTNFTDLIKNMVISDIKNNTNAQTQKEQSVAT